MQETNYLSGDEIASSIGVSSKTIRSDLMELGRIFKNHGLVIEAKQRYGYRLTITDIKKYREFLAHSWHNFAFESDELQKSSQRVNYLLRILLRERDYVKTDDLSDLIHVGKSQINRDLKKLRARLSDFDLSLESKPYHGIKITGPEMNKRLCIASSLPSGSDQLLFETNQSSTQKITVDLIQKIVLTVFNTFQYETSDIVFKNLIMHIFIALHRIEAGQAIILDEAMMVNVALDIEWPIAWEIVRQLEESLSIHIPEDEKGYICMHLSGKRILATQTDNDTSISQEIDQLVVNMLLRIKKRLDIDLTKDLDLRVSLGLHCVPLLKRIQYKLNLKNPLLDDVKKHKRSYIVATTAVGVIEETYQTKLSDDEIAYFGLHFYVALEKKKEVGSKKKVLIVCSTGKGTAKLLQYRFQKEFESDIDQLDVLDALSLTSAIISKYDLIVSTVLIETNLKIPIIYISNLLDNQDVSLIRRQLASHRSLISRFFDPDLFFVNVNFDTKEEVIAFLAAKFMDKYQFSSDFYDSIMQCESLASTEFDYGVAIPHPHHSFSENTIVSVAILNREIIWSKRKVQLVFLLSFGENEQEDIELFYEKSAYFLINSEDIKEAIRAQNYDVFISLVDKN